MQFEGNIATVKSFTFVQFQCQYLKILIKEQEKINEPTRLIFDIFKFESKFESVGACVASTIFPKR